MRKLLHLMLGCLCVLLAAIGAVLPVMPTTVFLILAAFFFTKGSPRLRQWLLDNPRIGPTIRDWEATGAIPRRIKLLSVSMMAGSFVLACFLDMHIALRVLHFALIAAGSAYVLSRPDA
nr:YbaN family protein [uncultured Celeribacter sp.]